MIRLDDEPIAPSAVQTPNREPRETSTGPRPATRLARREKNTSANASTPSTPIMNLHLAEPPRPVASILVGGAGRGARRNLDALARFNAENNRFKVEVAFADPALGKAAELARLANERGLTARAVEAPVQEVAHELVRSGPHGFDVLQVDRPGDIAAAARALGPLRRPLVIYVLVKRVGGRLAALRFYLRPGEDAMLARVVRFFERLDRVVLPRGKGAIWGAEGDPEDATMEPMLRAWAAGHLVGAIVKACSNISPDSAAAEYTEDGEETATLMLIESTGGFADPATLAREIAENPPAAVRRGETFVIAETATDAEGVRFHRVRLRSIDRGVSYENGVVLDADETQAAIAAERSAAERAAEAEARRVAMAEAAAAALAVAAAQTIDRRNGALSTD